MSDESRDQLWNSSWDTYYDSYYYELALSHVVGRLKIFDLVTKIVVALTATGSAVAGWSLWNVAGFKEIWVFIAGTAAVLSIVHAVIQVQSILTANAELRSSFSSMRLSLESFRQQLTIIPDFDVTEKNTEYQALRQKYEELVAKYDSSLLLTKKLANNVQSDLNTKLGVS